MSKKIFITFFLSFSYSIFAQNSSLLEIQNVIQKINYISYQNSSSEKTKLLIQQNFLKHVDFITIANKISNGWGHLVPKDKKKNFMSKLQKKIVKDLTVQIMSKKFSHLKIKRIRKVSFDKVKVTLATVSDFVNVDLILIYKDKKWLIVDVLINKDSLVKYYRDETNALINRYGLEKFLK